MSIQDEVLVRTVGEETCLEHQGGTGGIGKVALGKRSQQPLVFRIGLAIHPVGIDLLPAVMVETELEAGDQEAGKTVVAPLFEFYVEHRKHIRSESLGSPRLQPGE